MNNPDFSELIHLDMSRYVEKKPAGGNQTLPYLPWSCAWAAVLERYPDATYAVRRNPNTGCLYTYDALTGFWVETSITISGVTREMWLPVMDGSNHTMMAEAYVIKGKYRDIQVPAASGTDINRAIMRCFVKNLAMFGLGLYVFKGEDIPEPMSDDSLPAAAIPVKKTAPVKTGTAVSAMAVKRPPSRTADAEEVAAKPAPEKISGNDPVSVREPEAAAAPAGMSVEDAMNVVVPSFLGSRIGNLQGYTMREVLERVPKCIIYATEHPDDEMYADMAEVVEASKVLLAQAKENAAR